MRITHLLLASVLALTCVAPLAAHHSHVNYAISDFTYLEGTVKEVHIINPHSWIYMEVKSDKGEPEIWALESTNPAGLERKGVGRGFLKVGDAIKVRCHRSRDGANACVLGFLTPMHGDAARGHGIEKEWD